MGNAEAPGDDRKQLLETWINQYTDALLRVCYVSLRDRAQAEDATQETFLKAWQHMGQFRSKSDVSEKAWLMRIAVNTCRDYLRTAWFRRVDRRIAPEDVPQGAVEPKLPDNTVIREVMALSPKYKEVVLLRFYQGMKLHEIADTLHVSIETVKARLRVAKDKLRQGLEGWYFDEE